MPISSVLLQLSADARVDWRADRRSGDGGRRAVAAAIAAISGSLVFFMYGLLFEVKRGCVISGC